MEPLQVTGKLLIPAEELELSFARAGGPGGQNVNKVETKVCLRWSVRRSKVLSDAQRIRLLERLASRLVGEGELVVQASKHRLRGRNLTDARDRLATIVREGLEVARKRRPTRPTRGSKERRLSAKRRRSDIKRDRRAEPE